MGVGLIVGVWVARYLGPEQYGIYSYAIAVAALFGMLGTLGLDSIVVRDLARDPGNKNSILGTAFFLKLFGGAVGTITAIVTIVMLRPHDSLAQWLVGIIAFSMVFQAVDAIDFWFQSQMRSRFTVYAKNAAFVVSSTVKVALILGKASLIAFAWVGLAEAALGAVGLTIVYRLNGDQVRAWRLTWSKAYLLLQDSWPLILSGLAILIYMKIDQIMLGEMIGDQSVGLYTAATKISEVWYFVPSAIVASVSPMIFQSKELSSELYYARLSKLFRIVVMLAVAIAVPMTLLSNTVIHLLYGAAYTEASTVLAIHIWGAVFVFLGVAQGPWILAEGFTKLMLWRTLAGALTNVALNLILIPHYGIVGAAVATLIAQFVAAVAFHLLSEKTRRMYFMSVDAMTFGLLPWFRQKAAA